MQVWGVDAETAARTIRDVSISRYDGNLILDGAIRSEGFGRDGSPRIRVKLTVRDSSGPGHRVGNRRTSKGNRYRMRAACWHAYRDAIAALFDANPDARVKSALGDYRDRADFEARFAETGYRQIGPGEMYKDACECAE